MNSLTCSEHDNDAVKRAEMYKNILAANGILDPIANVSSADPGLIGEGSASHRRVVTVEFANPKLPPLHLFAKLQIQDVPDHYALTKELKAFEKEGTFLTKYVEAAKDLCTRKGLTEAFATDIYPKCFYADEQSVILENLKVTKGYQIIGKEGPHDWDTTAMALDTLARHHAISYALIQDAGGPDQFFQRFPVFKHDLIGSATWKAKLEPWMQSNMKINLKLLELNERLEGIEDAFNTLKGIANKKGTLSELCASTVETEDGELLVLNHGDYHYANMLFLKDPLTNKIVHQIAIDLQGVRYNSPYIDVAGYLFISSNTEMRQTRLKELLQHYLACLKKYSDDLGHPVPLVLDTLLVQYSKKIHLGLMMALGVRYGPGGEVMKSVDFSKVKDWGAFIDKLANEWVVANPAKAEKMALEIATVMKEYRELTLNTN